MRIAIFSDTYKPQVNGVVTVINILREGLEERGHKVFIYTVSHPLANPEEDVHERVYRVKSIKFPREPQHRFAFPPNPVLIKKLKEQGIQIIHSHSPFTMGHAALTFAKFLKVPVVHTFHTYFQEYRHYLGPFKIFMGDAVIKIITRNYCNMHDAIIAPSKKIEKVLKDSGVKVPIELVPNGVDIEIFSSQIPENVRKSFMKRFGIDQRDKVVIFVGRMAPEKSVDKLLENFSKVIEEVPEAKLLLVGDGPYRKYYEELAIGMGIRKKVVFTGYLKWPEEIAVAYKVSHVFASVSHTEVHPVTFIEAAASGLPLVAYKDLSIEGVLVDGVNGFSYKRKDEIYKGLVRLLKNEELRRSMGEESVKISKKFSSEKFVTKMEKVYEKYILLKKSAFKMTG